MYLPYRLVIHGDWQPILKTRDSAFHREAVAIGPIVDSLAAADNTIDTRAESSKVTAPNHRKRNLPLYMLA